MAVLYRVARDGELAETSVHFDRIKVYLHDALSSVPNFIALYIFVIENTLPVPDLDGSVLALHIGPFIIQDRETRHNVGYKILTDIKFNIVYR